MLSKIKFIGIAATLPTASAFFTGKSNSADYQLKKHPDGSVHLFEQSTTGTTGGLRRKLAQETDLNPTFTVHGSQFIKEKLEVDGDTQIDGVLKANGDLKATANVEVDGTVQFTSAGAVHTIAGSVQMTEPASSLEVTGDVTMASAATFTGSQSVVAVAGTLVAEGAVDLGTGTNDVSLKASKFTGGTAGDKTLLAVTETGAFDTSGVVNKGKGVYECSICERTLDNALSSNTTYLATEKQLVEADTRVTAEKARAIAREDEIEALIDGNSADLTSNITALQIADESIDLRLSLEESTRGKDDASLTKRLSLEESTRGKDDASLTKRLSQEESTRAIDDISLGQKLGKDAASLDVRVGLEESTRDDDDASLTKRLSQEESTRGKGDTDLQTNINLEESTRDADDASLTKRLSLEESTRGKDDASLTKRLSQEESTRAIDDISLGQKLGKDAASLDVRVGLEESTRDDDDASLTKRLSEEESTRKKDDDSLELRVSLDEKDMADAVDMVTKNLELISRASIVEDLDHALSALMKADWDYSTALFVKNKDDLSSVGIRVSDEESTRTIDDISLSVRVQTIEDSTGAKTETLSMIKILCNTLGIDFDKLYKHVTPSGDQQSDQAFIDAMARSDGVGFNTVQIASDYSGSGLASMGINGATDCEDADGNQNQQCDLSA